MKNVATSLLVLTSTLDAPTDWILPFRPICPSLLSSFRPLIFLLSSAKVNVTWESQAWIRSRKLIC